jgi:hypothetical protein
LRRLKKKGESGKEKGRQTCTMRRDRIPSKVSEFRTVVFMALLRRREHGEAHKLRLGSSTHTQSGLAILASLGLISPSCYTGRCK